MNQLEPDAGGGRSDEQQESQLARWPERQAILRALFDEAPRALLLTGPDGTLKECNAVCTRLLGYAREELVGRRFNDITVPEDAALGLQALRDMLSGAVDHAVFEKRYFRKDGEVIWARIHVNPIRDAAGKVSLFVTSLEDITEDRRREAVQLEMLRQLSTPLIPIAEGVIALPLIGPVDSDRADHMLQALLDGVSSNRAEMVILDITGVPCVEGEVAALFVRATQAVRLLGADVVLSGMRPEVAQRLVSLGIDLSGVQTVGNFKSAIALALGHLRRI